MQVFEQQCQRQPALRGHAAQRLQRVEASAVAQRARVAGRQCFARGAVQAQQPGQHACIVIRWQQRRHRGLPQRQLLRRRLAFGHAAVAHEQLAQRAIRAFGLALGRLRGQPLRVGLAQRGQLVVAADQRRLRAVDAAHRMALGHRPQAIDQPRRHELRIALQRQRGLRRQVDVAAHQPLTWRNC